MWSRRGARDESTKHSVAEKELSTKFWFVRGTNLKHWYGLITKNLRGAGKKRRKRAPSQKIRLVTRG